MLTVLSWACNVLIPLIRDLNPDGYQLGSNRHYQKGCTRPEPLPAYRRQRKAPGVDSPTDRAFVRLKGKRVYLGHDDSPESRKKYAELTAELQPPEPVGKYEPQGSKVTVAEVVVMFLEYAEDFYFGRDGKPSPDYDHYRGAVRILTELCLDNSANRFGPKKLKDARELMIDEGWTDVDGRLMMV